MEICLQWEFSADQARKGNFTEAQARKVVSDIAQRSGMGAIEFATTQQFLIDWIKGKESTKRKETRSRIATSLKNLLNLLEPAPLRIWEMFGRRMFPRLETNNWRRANLMELQTWP